MRRNIISAFLAMVVFTIALGVIYPVVVTGIAQVAFAKNANGNPDLIAKDTKGDPRLFQPRPSQTGYSADATAFSNRGPNQKSALAFYREQIAAYIKLNGRYYPGLTAAKIPVDAVTTSGSGVDPHISVANARIQAHRVAAVRGIPLAEVDKLVDEHTDGRFLGLLGEPGVNTTTLNEALGR